MRWLEVFLHLLSFRTIAPTFLVSNRHSFVCRFAGRLLQPRAQTIFFETSRSSKTRPKLSIKTRSPFGFQNIHASWVGVSEKTTTEIDIEISPRRRNRRRNRRPRHSQPKEDLLCEFWSLRKLREG